MFSLTTKTNSEVPTQNWNWARNLEFDSKINLIKKKKLQGSFLSNSKMYVHEIRDK